METSLELLEARARRVLGDRPVGEVLVKARAIIGVPNIPDGEKDAQSALDKLRKPKLGKPTPREISALELVIRMMRPAPLCQKGRLDPLPGNGGHLFNSEISGQWDGFRNAIAPLLYSIGRVDGLNIRNGQAGTGFLVGPDLLATNRHVLEYLSFGANALEEGQAVVRFHQEFGGDEPTGSVVPVTGVAAIHPVLDMVLLHIRQKDPRPPLPLDELPVSPGQAVAAVGYPTTDSFRNPIFADAIFSHQYGVKRGALGEVIDVVSDILFHDCSTMGGNSGSPIFSLKTARVVALHRSGLFMYRNEAIAGEALRGFVQGHLNN